MGLDLDQLQEDIATWADKTFPDHTTLSIAKHLLSEASELYQACGGTPYDASLIAYTATHKEDSWVHRGDNAADVFILLLTLAQHENFLLSEAIFAKHSVNLGRKWQSEPNKHGFIEHDRTGEKEYWERRQEQAAQRAAETEQQAND